MSEDRASSGERGRWSSRRKMELGVTAGTIALWREQFLAGKRR